MLGEASPIWSLVGTMQTEAFLTFREFTDGASAIQSRNYKGIEATPAARHRAHRLARLQVGSRGPGASGRRPAQHRRGVEGRRRSGRSPPSARGRQRRRWTASRLRCQVAQDPPRLAAHMLGERRGTGAARAWLPGTRRGDPRLQGALPRRPRRRPPRLPDRARRLGGRCRRRTRSSPEDPQGGHSPGTQGLLAGADPKAEYRAATQQAIEGEGSVFRGHDGIRGGSASRTTCTGTSTTETSRAAAPATSSSSSSSSAGEVGVAASPSSSRWLNSSRCSKGR